MDLSPNPDDAAGTAAASALRAVALARAAQREFGALPVRERARQVARFRDLVVSRAEELSRLLAEETGKTPGEALSMEVMVVADLATYFTKRAHRILAPRRIPLHLLKTRASYLHYVPRGVVGIISPWNFPFGLGAGGIVMALLAGNAVVHKPSEFTPNTALWTKSLFEEAGLSPDLLQVLPGGGGEGAALIESGIDYCLFIGSTTTGRKVGAACAGRLIPFTLELGGKAPAIVCADADVERTARALVWGAFANQGQVCAAVERVYAHRAVHDALVDRVVALTGALRLGGEGEPTEVDAGAMISERQASAVEARVASAVEQGATLRAGGRRSGRGLQILPTVLTGCRQDMDVMRDEIFGPVMPIARVEDEDEAVACANDSRMGLVAYVFTRDRAKGRRLAERLEAGTVMVNDCLLAFAMPETPWAGVKQSGIGRTHSADGLRDLCQARHVNYDRLALRREFWWYPYSERLRRQTLSAMRWLFR